MQISLIVADDVVYYNGFHGSPWSLRNIITHDILELGFSK